MDWQTKQWIEESFDELNNKLDRIMDKLEIKFEDLDFGDDQDDIEDSDSENGYEPDLT